jgi:hypothetical protein
MGKQSTLKKVLQAREERVQKYDNILKKKTEAQRTINPIQLVLNFNFNGLDYDRRVLYNYKFKTKSDNPQRQVGELLGVIRKYKAPAHLEQAVINSITKGADKPAYGVNMARSSMMTEKFIKWYSVICNGQSFYKECAKGLLSKQEAHAFLTCSYKQLTAVQALVFAMAKTFAPNDGVALRIAMSKLSNCERYQIDEQHKTIIYFFARNPVDSIDELNDLVDYIKFQMGIRRTDGKANFTLAGHSLKSIQKRTKDWHYELRRQKAFGDEAWHGCCYDDIDYQVKSGDGSDVIWHFKQIKNSKALAAEGTAMRHCVYSYKRDCINDRLYIWSLSKTQYGQMTRKVTIELSNSGVVNQARGVANRSMRPEERSIVSQWAKDHGFTLYSYL